MPTPQIGPEELAALDNDHFFRLKSSLDDKVKDLFTLLKDNLEAVSKNIHCPLPEVLKLSPGRRFQGENHHGFPWRALDFPRKSTKPDLFIFRCLLLWGHSFAFHLILSGQWKEHYLESLLNSRQSLGDLGFYIDSRSSAWEWFQDHPSIFPLSALQREKFSQLAHSQPHLKLSLFVPLSEFSQIPEIGCQVWDQLQSILFSQD